MIEKIVVLTEVVVGVGAEVEEHDRPQRTGTYLPIAAALLEQGHVLEEERRVDLRPRREAILRP